MNSTPRTAQDDTQSADLVGARPIFTETSSAACEAVGLWYLSYPIHTEIFAPKINEINFIPGRTVFVTSEKYRPTNHRPRTALCH